MNKLIPSFFLAAFPVHFTAVTWGHWSRMGRMWCERWSVSWHEWVLTQTHTGTQSRLVHYKKWCGILLQYEQQEHELRKSRRLFLVLSHLSSQIDVNQATDLIRLKEFVSRILKQKVLQLIWCFRFYWKHRRLTVFILSWICLRWLIFFKKVFTWCVSSQPFSSLMPSLAWW